METVAINSNKKEGCSMSNTSKTLRTNKQGNFCLKLFCLQIHWSYFPWVIYGLPRIPRISTVITVKKRIQEKSRKSDLKTMPFNICI